LGPKSNIGISPNEVTIAEICKQKGYATGCFGKWHLGHHKKFLPKQHGFDEYFGLPYSNDMWPYHPGVLHLPMEERIKRWPHLPLIEGNKVINPKVSAKDQEKLTTQYTERAVSFIAKNKDKPFFAYIPHSMVHVPLYVSKKFKGKSGAGLFGDVMMEVDWSVGQIMKTLKKHKLEKNTLFIFTSDNGPWLNYGDHAGSAAPLREGKGTMFEGGCREPTLAWWPGKIPANSVCKEPLMTIDLLPTIAEMIGAKLPGHRIDGKNILPLMLSDDAKSPHKAYYFYNGNQLQAVRQGKWKLHFPHGYRTMAGKPGGTGGIPTNYSQAKIELSLFDLHQDIGESKDLKAEFPDIVTRLSELGKKFDEKLKKTKRQPGKI
jgi:arylsulfatase A-like enzyme